MEPRSRMADQPEPAEECHIGLGFWLYSKTVGLPEGIIRNNLLRWCENKIEI